MNCFPKRNILFGIKEDFQNEEGLAMILSLAMIAGVLAGCGDKESESALSDRITTESTTEIVQEEEVTTEEEGKIYTIDVETLCNRELHDFFELHLGCYVDYALGNENTEPINISDMRRHSGIVGAIVSADGMRVVSDYDDSLFGLQLQGTDLMMNVRAIW